MIFSPNYTEEIMADVKISEISIGLALISVDLMRGTNE
jgi:pyridoxine 5'-phosphate synthase PdxJ